MDAATWLTQAGQVASAPSIVACERFGPGLLGQPANTVTSLAFVLAGAAILACRRGVGGQRWPFGLLVIAVGVGSVLQHGPHPPWQAYAHDLPLVGLLAFVAADAAADLTGRRMRGWWWLLVPVALVPVVAIGPLASTVAQALVAAVAVGLSLARARSRPRVRRTLLTASAVLAAGALAGSLTDRTPLCQPDSLLQGHAAWHVLAAAAMWLLAPAIGSRGAPARPGRVTADPGSGGAESDPAR